MDAEDRLKRNMYNNLVGMYGHEMTIDIIRIISPCFTTLKVNAEVSREAAYSLHGRYLDYIKEKAIRKLSDELLKNKDIFLREHNITTDYSDRTRYSIVLGIQKEV